MALGKKAADIGYKSFTISMLLLTGYGSFLVGHRIVNFMRTKDSPKGNAKSALAVPDAVVADSKQ